MTACVSDDELVQRFPGEPISHDNAAHYRGRLGRELLLNRCGQCRHWHAPPKPVCPECWSSEVSAEPVSGDGVIFMAIFLHRGPVAPGVDYRVPYPVVAVELAEQEGLRFTSTVVGADNQDVKIGTPVRLAWVERSGSPMPVFELRDPT
jgi:uncharacterized protein